MAPIFSLPADARRATRAACGPEKEKSSCEATPRSKTSRCSGSASTDCSMCSLLTRSGFRLASAWTRKSACFWLFPSRQTRSPHSITACSRSAMRAGGRLLPSSSLPNAARARCNRASRFCCKVFQDILFCSHNHVRQAGCNRWEDAQQQHCQHHQQQEGEHAPDHILQRNVRCDVLDNENIQADRPVDQAHLHHH